MTHDQKIPMFARVILVGGLILLVLMVWGAFKIQDLVRDRQQESCDRTIQAREDNRTMWLYLLDTNGGSATAQQVAEFTQALDTRLPPLECVNRQPVPVDQ